MKKIFCILSILAIISPVFADDEPGEQNQSEPLQQEEQQQTETVSAQRTLPAGFTLPDYGTLTNGVASAAYVNGAYDTMDYLKEDRLNDRTLGANESATNGDVIHTTADYTAANVTAPAKPFVSSVSATSGVVNIVNAEVSVPVGSYASPTARAPIWVE